MFSSSTSPFGNFSKIKLVNTITQEYVAIIPEFGAIVNELVLHNGKSLYSIVDGDTTPHEVLLNETFKSSKLTPFPNRINKGKYSFEGENYELNTNLPPHAIHGLVLDKPFRILLLESNEQQATLKVDYEYEKEVAGYPFSFRTEIEYIFNNKGLTKNTLIQNTSEGNIPMADGWHLYFKGVNKVNDYHLQLPTETILVCDETLIPTGQTNPFSDFSTSKLLGEKTFDDCFELNNKEGIAEILLSDSAEELTISIWQETGHRKYNFLQVYTPPNRKSIAIEPMTAYPDAFNNGKGLVILLPQETMQISCGIGLKK